MRFWVLHVDDRRGDENEEAVLADPATKVASFFPLSAIGAFIPLAAEASEGAPAVRCCHCSAPLPAPTEDRRAAPDESA